MLSRKASATAELPADFPTMNREMQTLVGVLGMVNHQDQSGIETEILGLGMTIEEQKIRTDTDVTNHLIDREVRGRETMTVMFKGEKEDQKDGNMMRNMMT
uniref:RNA-binding motif protein, X-linked 2 n=1 Tax=Arundo donax TaxID=35708 RepID=A0A0A9DBY5_ARUDO